MPLPLGLKTTFWIRQCGQFLHGPVFRPCLRKGSLTIVVERQPDGFLEGPSGLPGHIVVRSSGPGFHEHWNVVAPEVRSDAPLDTPCLGRAAEGGVRGCLTVTPDR